MGFIDRVAGAISSGERQSEMEEQSEEFADEFEEGFEEGDDEFEDGFEMEDEEAYEWDNPYRFAEEMLEPDGFASMTDFIVKAMYYECSNSPLYRDRIQQGAQTIEMVSTSVETLRGMRGGGGSTDYNDVADKLEDMDRAVQAADSLSGKEDQMIQDGMEVAREFAQAIGTASQTRNGEVQSDVRETDGSL